MPKVVSYSDAMSKAGSLYIFCTTSETEKIADTTERAGSWISIFSSVLDPASMIAIRAVAAFIPWKARRCLKRNKCLMISVAFTPTLHEYDPYDSNDGWYQIYSRLFLVNGISKVGGPSTARLFLGLTPGLASLRPVPGYGVVLGQLLLDLRWGNAVLLVASA